MNLGKYGVNEGFSTKTNTHMSEVRVSRGGEGVKIRLGAFPTGPAKSEWIVSCRKERSDRPDGPGLIAWLPRLLSLVFCSNIAPQRARRSADPRLS